MCFCAGFSIHPFSSPDSVFRSGFLGEQSKQSSLFSPTSSSSYLLHNKAFPSQSGDTICSAYPGSAPGFPTGKTDTKHLGCVQEASWVRCLNHLNCLALMWRSSSYTLSSTWKSQLLNLSPIGSVPKSIMDTVKTIVTTPFFTPWLVWWHTWPTSGSTTTSKGNDTE